MSPSRSRSITLAAIARDEGPYLADWVLHHLRMGFHEVDVFLNRTTDTSAEVLAALRDDGLPVRWRVADEMLDRCLASGRNFQHRAYAQLARRAEQRGATHVAFLDLDEYWLPRDLTTPVGDFLPDDPGTNVVSFPWALDVPDPAAEPFRHPLERAPLLQLDPHVKSVVRLDERVRQLRTHTARTHDGRRLLVRDPFPLVDEAAQQWGSLVPDAWLAERHDALPEAFVLHAVHRSVPEYLGSLARGLRQTGSDVAVKSNRPGFVPNAAPRLPFPDSPAARAAAADHLAARDETRRRLGVDALVAVAERALLARGEALVAAAAADPAVLQQLRGPARGLRLPALDAARPGWDRWLTWHLDAVEEIPGGGLRVVGWAYDPPRDSEAGRRLEWGLRDLASPEVRPLHPGREVSAVERADVAATQAGAPPAAGFVVEVGDPPPRPVLLVRPVGAQLWDERVL